jgi:hypothetical protein
VASRPPRCSCKTSTTVGQHKKAVDRLAESTVKARCLFVCLIRLDCSSWAPPPRTRAPSSTSGFTHSWLIAAVLTMISQSLGAAGQPHVSSSSSCSPLYINPGRVPSCLPIIKLATIHPNSPPSELIAIDHTTTSLS